LTLEFAKSRFSIFAALRSDVAPNAPASIAQTMSARCARYSVVKELYASTRSAFAKGFGGTALEPKAEPSLHCA
jgi:hypothetical protein